MKDDLQGRARRTYIECGKLKARINEYQCMCNQVRAQNESKWSLGMLHHCLDCELGRNVWKRYRNLEINLKLPKERRSLHIVRNRERKRKNTGKMPVPPKMMGEGKWIG